MTSAIPFLWYLEKADEAVQFYTEVFDDASYSTEGPFGDMSDTPVQVFRLTLFGQPFVVMGAGGGTNTEFNDSFSIQLDIDSQEELDRYWDAILAAGGTEQACGWIVDQFGLRWQMVPKRYLELVAQGGDVAQRVREAMRSMIRLDVAELEAAAAGLT